MWSWERQWFICERIHWIRVRSVPKTRIKNLQSAFFHPHLALHTYLYCNPNSREDSDTLSLTSEFWIESESGIFYQVFWKIYGRRDRKTDINYLSISVIYLYLHFSVFMHIHTYTHTGAMRGEKGREGTGKEERGGEGRR